MYEENGNVCTVSSSNSEINTGVKKKHETKQDAPRSFRGQPDIFVRQSEFHITTFAPYAPNLD